MSSQARITAISPEAKLRFLGDLVAGMNLGMSVEEVLNYVYGHLHEFVPYNRLALAVTDERRERLYIVATRSDGRMILMPGYSGAIAGSSLEPLLRDGTMRIINDLEEYLAQKPQSESTRLIVKEGMRSNLTLPLVVQGKPVGVMFFSSRQAHAYRPEHEEFLRSIAAQMSIAVERTRLLEALREKSEYLENILQNSTDAIVVVDVNNRIQAWNEGARRIFGYEPEEAIGAPYTLFVPPESDREEATRIKKQVELEGFLKDYECVRMTKDGRRIVVQVTSTLLRDKRGRVLGRSSIVRDVTHLKKLQEELVRSQSLAALGELAATVAHEIKNPLAGISGAIQVMADSIPVEDGRHEIVREILDQIRRLDNTVRDLLVFARPTKPVLTEVDLAETLTRAWSLLAQQPGAKDVRFAIEGPADMRVPADPHLIQQVWINVFQNAVEAMPQGGRITVRLGVGPKASVEIRDTGSGVSAENLGNVFRPFFSTKTRGTGLGLAISRKIVESHGGEMSLRSQPGAGTTVLVEIPR